MVQRKILIEMNHFRILLAALLGFSLSCSSKPSASLLFGSTPRLVSVPSSVQLKDEEGFSKLSQEIAGFNGLVFTRVLANSQSIEQGRREIVWVRPNGQITILTSQFFSASDPEVSFDGKRVLFSGKQRDSDRWQIFEMGIDGSNVRRVVHDEGDCRSPIYQSKLYIITTPKPWYQISYVSYRHGKPYLFSSRLDGSAVRRLTYHPSGALDPVLMDDGRILFSQGDLFGVNLDGSDYARFSIGKEDRPQRMPVQVHSDLVAFVEPKPESAAAGGNLAGISLRRSLYSRRLLTEKGDGLFYSPSRLLPTEILVSHRPASDKGTFDLFRFNIFSGDLVPLQRDPLHHLLQAKVLAPRPEPDGRSSVVTEKIKTSKFYGLDLYTTDFLDPTWWPKGLVKRLRVVEGREETPSRILGEFDLAKDGSFNFEMPANIPIKLQALDENGMALRSCDWIWAKNREWRGCIGCHEDPELTPPNRMSLALKKPSRNLVVPPEDRREVTYYTHVRPLLRGCRAVGCHGPTDEMSLVSYDQVRKLVHPGRARTSPLVTTLFAKEMSRPWDRGQTRTKPCSHGKDLLTDKEKRTVVEWIDLGAFKKGSRP